MIKLICPRCMKPVPVADDFAGREVTCPSCMKPFDVPPRYTPAVLPEPAAPAPEPPPALAAAPAPPAAPPPGPPMPPTPPAAPPGYVQPVPVAPAAPAAVPALPGYTEARGITISPRVVAWLPAVLLTVVFVSLFFRWVGSYYGGHPAHSQSPWQAMFGSVSRNFELEQNMPGRGAWIDKVSADWRVMFPYLVLLLVALAFAWADRLAPGLDPSRLPRRVAGVWPWRKVVVGVAAGLGFSLIAAQVSSGFGMERAIRRHVSEDPNLVKAREAAANSPAALAKVENDERAELRKYELERTWWQDLGLYCSAGAVLAVLLSAALDRRGNKPPPRLLLHY
ncbi:MAG: hypothetical protein C0501_07500 [Isosphaera sp.]|nr:hypothetical protein [Isosphaera sp.]